MRSQKEIHHVDGQNEAIDDLTRVILLTFAVDPAKPIHGKTRIIKVLFLVIYELFPELVDQAEFFPHHFGPYSVQVAKRLNQLLDQEIIQVRRTQNDWAFSLTEKGKILAEQVKQEEPHQNTLEQIKKIRGKLANKNLKQILRELYSTYPEFAYRSRILEEIYGHGEVMKAA